MGGKNLLAASGLALLGLASNSACATKSIDNIAETPKSHVELASGRIPSFGETIKLDFSEFPLTIEKVENYGPLGLSGVRILQDFYFSDVLVSDNKVAIGIYSNTYRGPLTDGKEVTFRMYGYGVGDGSTITNIPGYGEIRIPRGAEIKSTSNVAVADLVTGRAIDVSGPFKRIQQSAGIEVGKIDPLDFDISQNYAALVVRTSQEPKIWGAFVVNLLTGNATRVTQPTDHVGGIDLEGRVLVFENSNKISAIDFGNLKKGAYNLSEGIFGHYRQLENSGEIQRLDDGGIVVFNNVIGSVKKDEVISGWEHFDSTSTRLYSVDTSRLGNSRITKIRKPVSPGSKQIRYVEAIADRNIIYTEAYKDKYFVSNSATGRINPVTREEVEKLLMERQGIGIYGKIRDKKAGEVNSFYVKTPSMPEPVQVSDPRYSAWGMHGSPPRLLPGNRVLFEEDQGKGKPRYFYILNLK